MTHGCRVILGGGLLVCFLWLATTEQVSVIISPELLTKKVQGKRVDTRVDEGQTETNDLEDMPEHIVQTRVIVKPEDVCVSRQPTDHEHNHKWQHNFGNFLTSFHLSLLLVGYCTFLQKIYQHDHYFIWLLHTFIIIKFTKELEFNIFLFIILKIYR